jgi:hypothetical protein
LRDDLAVIDAQVRHQRDAAETSENATGMPIAIAPINDTRKMVTVTSVPARPPERH